MASISTIPSQYAQEKARSVGKDVNEFINIHKSINVGDIRAMHKSGIFWEDFLITRDDGSKFSLHEENSEVEGLHKFIITLYENERERNILAYTDYLDFKRLQYDQQYLDVFAEELLSIRRIREKVNVSLSHGNSEYIYVGTVIQNARTGRYEKGAQLYEQVANAIARQKREKEERATIAKQQEVLRRQELIKKISEKLHYVDTKKLEQIAMNLGISTNQHKDYNDYNDRKTS